MKIVILDDWENCFRNNPLLKTLENKHDVTVYNDKPGNNEVINRLKNADIVIPIRERTKFTKELLNEVKNLKMIAQTGSGTAHIDIEEAERLNISVRSTTGGHKSVVELIFGFILAFNKKIIGLHEEMKDGQWPELLVDGLEKKTIGIIGLGKIGSGVAKIAKAFDMRVVAWGPRLTEERALKEGVEYLSFEELLRESDFITVNVRLVPETKDLIGEKQFNLMKPGAFFLNTSRGEIVNEKALIRALQEKWIGGAGLDVFVNEPLPAQHPLRSLQNVILSPHIGWKTDTVFNLFLSESIQNIEEFLRIEEQRSLS
ncbi:D-2-hydroxyacid dehydrogenase family protein [Planomicrobium sp. CPCC 101079]|uniref:D-2-hydroxyacid dehydrogenase family protein n=1 Tax=Planomicrobium sp. CPCC 101079 TaxID=2599618 RepID=UPI0011B5621F|nr:D-2-hydroxyacid dehydrogenase family protein [Planomicrobium sp. CPCC 101079]TWT01840.1 D-2-hydroxyacid dehydrogenase family protein [Planomicrobium sp. CPCC 101079]